MSRRWIFILLAAAILSGSATAENTDPSARVRKVIHRVAPVYPELARKMSIRGTVRVVAVVSPNGSVKSVEPVGGSPILLKAAHEAVINWKFAAAPEETKELIELEFGH